MEASYIGYLLFVIPGFVLVWTYRHFTKSKNNIGEFEYAAWSFLWGAPLLVSFVLLGNFLHNPFPVIPLDNLAAALGGFSAFSFILGIGAAFPLGILGASIANKGLFAWLDKILFKLVE